MNSLEDQKNNSINLNQGKKSVFSKIFSFWKIKRKSKIKNSYDDLDKKLVYSLSPKKIPSFRQLKYTKKVLNPREKLIVNISLILILITFLFLGIRFYKKHLVVYPSFGGEYIEGLIGSPKNINPLYDFARDVDSDISRLIFSSLFKRGKDGEIIKDLTDDYSISDNGLEYLIKIKDGVKWHHGEDLNSDDIIFTFEAIKNPEYGSPLRSIFVGVIVDKIDDLTIKFTLTEPYSAFLELLTFGVLPQNLWMNVSPQNAFLNELNIKPIGSGPYKFKSLTKNKSGDIREFTLIANADYYDQFPYIGKIILKFYNNYNELISALNNNQVNGISYLPHSLKSELISQNSLRFNRLSLPQITSIFLSSKKNPILGSIKIRQALIQLIDKSKICNEIFSGNAGEAYGPILPNSSSYNDDVDKYDYNYDEANNILDEAGWEIIYLDESETSLILEVNDIERRKKDFENNMSIALENEENNDFNEAKNNLQLLINELEARLEQLQNIENLEIKKIIIESFYLLDNNLSGNWRFKKSSDQAKKYDFLTINLTTVDLIDNITVAEFIKFSWERAGIKTFIKIINPNQVQSEIIKQRNFEALLLSQVLGGDQDTYSFWHSSQAGEGGLNISEYKNREIDKLLEDARLSLSSDERIQKYKKFQELLNKDLPVIFLYFPTYTYTQNKKIKGFDFNSVLNPADRFNNVSRWYIKVNRKIEF